MMRRLDYQERVLETLSHWLEALNEEREKAEKIAKLAEAQPELELPVPDFTEKVWERLREEGRLPASRKNIPFSPRRDGIGRPVPNAVLKIPTGGGKTWLAVNALSRIFGSYVGRNTGFVLWIVPNEAIYAQTLRRLRDRADPYRQALDAAAAGRVRILEKEDTLNKLDVEANLCVMVLMLQSANRQTKAVLRMFRDRGDVHGFTPPEGDERAHKELKERIPNLDTYDLADSPVAWPMVKASLGNALRIIRPVVVMDEGHKATSDLAYETLYGFNPRLVLELTATPKDVKPRGGRNPRPARFANVLAEVSGVELDREGMIKMPINLETRQEEDWRITLRKAVARLEGLRRAAEEYQANGGRYIRPIMLVQVERTGKEQMDAGFIHANDVKDWLLQAGLDEAEIAIKTAEQNDLNQPENQDLLSPLNRVRVIITKQALQEGWDCPFAYILCSLAANTNQSAMTQLVGRILRQPYAMKTGVAALDECWVVTHHASTAKVVQAVKKGLEQDGLGDLVLQVAQEDAASVSGVAWRIPRREKFANLKIFLPLVLHVGEDGARELDYDTDILSAIDWRDYDPAGVAERIPAAGTELETLVQRLRVTDGDDLIEREVVRRAPSLARFDPAHAARMIGEIVPNAFQAREIVGRLLAALRARGLDGDKLGPLAEYIIDALYRALEKERLRRAEEVFRRKVESGEIRFRLRLDGRDWKMPDWVETTQPEEARQLVGSDGGPLERSLFAPQYEADFNKAEREVAVYLDGQEALKWWHRNVARKQYGLQGWRRGRIYPDFIFAMNGEGRPERIIVLETKGDQLEGNLDTEYKRKLLELLTEHFDWEEAIPAGMLEVAREQGRRVQCELVLMSEWKERLARLFGEVEA